MRRAGSTKRNRGFRATASSQERGRRRWRRHPAGNQSGFIGTERSAPSRRAASCLDRHRPATAPQPHSERGNSRTKSSVMLIVTIVTTTMNLATSPVAADSRRLATSRMTTKGLRKRARNCSQSGKCLTVAAVLGRYLVTRVPRLCGSEASTVVAVRREAGRSALSRFLRAACSPFIGSVYHRAVVRSFLEGSTSASPALSGDAPVAGMSPRPVDGLLVGGALEARARFHFCCHATGRLLPTGDRHLLLTTDRMIIIPAASP